MAGDGRWDLALGRMLGHVSEAPQHRFLLLTKRIGRAREWVNRTSFYPGGDRSQRPVLGFPPNLWLGVSVEDQASADERIPILLDTPAAHRWVSIEPQVGPVSLGDWTYQYLVEKCTNASGERTEWCGGGMFGLPSYCLHGCPHAQSTGGINWVVTGCEAGPGRRPFDHDWARLTRDQCAAAGVCWYYKQAPDRVSPSVIVKHPTLDGLRHDALPWVTP